MQLGAEFLISNEKRENPDRGGQLLKTAMPPAALFSPRRQALEVGGGTVQQLPLTTPLPGYGNTQFAYAAEEAKYSGQPPAAPYTYGPQGQPPEPSRENLAQSPGFGLGRLTPLSPSFSAGRPQTGFGRASAYEPAPPAVPYNESAPASALWLRRRAEAAADPRAAQGLALGPSPIPYGGRGQLAHDQPGGLVGPAGSPRHLARAAQHPRFEVEREWLERNQERDELSEMDSLSDLSVPSAFSSDHGSVHSQNSSSSNASNRSRGSGGSRHSPVPRGRSAPPPRGGEPATPSPRRTPRSARGTPPSVERALPQEEVMADMVLRMESLALEQERRFYQRELERQQVAEREREEARALERTLRQEHAAAMQAALHAQQQQQLVQHSALEAQMQQLLQQNGTLQHTGMEKWLVEKRMRDDFDRPFLFWSVQYSRWEDSQETALRAAVWAELCKRLPKTFTTRIYIFDVRAVYQTMCSLNMSAAEAQVDKLDKKIIAHTKGKTPMREWLESYWTLLDERDQLGKPMEVTQILGHIRRSLAGDQRYTPALREMAKHPSWGPEEVKTLLYHEAQLIDDLIARDPVLTSRKAKTQEEHESDDEAETQKLSRKARRALKAQAQQRSHPQAANTAGGAAAAEAGRDSHEKRQRLKNEVCINYLTGSCRFGVECSRRHVDLDQLKLERAAKESKRLAQQGTTPAAGDTSKEEKPAADTADPDTDTKVCYGFRDNGVCSYGDNCRFDHGQGHSRKARLLPTLPLREGDLVQLDQCAEHPHACGSTAQLMEITPKGVAHVQFLDKVDGEGPASLRHLERALSASAFVRIPSEEAPAHSKKARRAAPSERYNANAIFDTGADHLSSSCVGIFESIRDVPPMNVEGYNGQITEVNKGGLVVLNVGGYTLRVQGYYTPGEPYTIVPGEVFDDGTLGFKAFGGALTVFHKDGTELAHFPRDITCEGHESYTQTFKSNLGPRTHRKKRRHALYPLADSTFVWHERSKQSLPVARARVGKTPKSENAKGTRPDLEWAEAALKPDNKRDKAIRRGLQLYQEFHDKCHYSQDHTARTLEWVCGHRLPDEVLENAPPCEACAAGKIHSHPASKHALIEPAEVGEIVAADTIVGYPRSLSGYRHVAHFHDVKSNFGAVFLMKSKIGSHLLITWLKRVKLVTGRDAACVRIDGGEYKTTDLVAHAAATGSKILVNMAGVHQNMTIERRHLSFERMSASLMHKGCAGPTLWEFAAPQAGFLLNITWRTAVLRAVGRPGKGKTRPLTPFEEFENHGKMADMQKIWRSMHPLFQNAVAHVVARPAHGKPGRPCVYFGNISEQGGISMNAHYVLWRDTQEIGIARTVRCLGTWAFEQHPQPLLRAAPQPPGGEEQEPDSDNEDEEAAGSAIGGSDGAGATEEKEEEPVSQKGLRAPDKHAPGDAVMCTAGPAEVLERHPDGDYCIRVEADEPPDDCWTVGPSQIWKVEDYPDWVYDADGKRAPAWLDESKTAGPLQRKPRMKVWEDKAPPEQPRAGKTHAYNLRRGRAARAMGDAHYRVWETETPGRNSSSESATQLRARRAHMQKRIVIPEGIPAGPTSELLRTMDASVVGTFLPKHRHQLAGNPLKRECLKGEVRELQDCINQGVWGTPRKRQPRDVVIGLMWVYALKLTLSTGKFDRVRSRITLMGNQEREQDLVARLDAYAPVSQNITTRMLIAMHLHIPGVRILKRDVKNAYINEDMKRSILVRVPPGYQIKWQPDGQWTLRRLRPGEKQIPGWALPLIKALYGGMECGRIFWEAWVDWHLAHGFQIIHEERCYLYKYSPDGSFIKLGYHVDDSTTVVLGDEFYAAYKKELNKKFTVTEEPLEENLGVHYAFDWEKRTVRLTQATQTRKFLQIYGMENCKAEKAPMPTGPEPCAADCEEPPTEEWDMECFVGHGNFLHCCTRPDIGKALKVLSRYTKKFGKRHVQWAKHLLRYLKGTINEGLFYTAEFPLYLQIFTDASHAGCVDTRRSTTSLVIKLGGNTVFWKTAFTTIVCHSSCESELMALDVGATIGQAARWLLQSMGGPLQGKLQIFVDNQGTIDISSNPVQAGRNLHIHARYFYVRDQVYDGQFQICWLPTDLQVADVGCSFKGIETFLALKRVLMGCARIKHNVHGEPEWEVGTGW